MANPLVNPLTNTADVNAHYINLISLSDGSTTEIRDKFVDKNQIASVAESVVQVTPEYAVTELAWPTPTSDEQVPGLDSLIRWLQQEGTGGGGEKHYHITRNSFAQVVTQDNVVTLAGRKGRAGRRGFLGFTGDDGISRRGMRGE